MLSYIYFLKTVLKITRIQNVKTENNIFIIIDKKILFSK